MTKRYFTGFSTIGSSQNRSWVLHDIDLIKRDLLNHFHTRKGERVLRPTYGCSIWEYIHEQLTPDVVERIGDEVERVVNLDSRTEMRNFDVQTYRNGIVILVDLFYRPYDMVSQLRIEFEARQ